MIEKKVPNPTGKGGFKKGKSGNPNGRPLKEHTMTDILNRLGDIEDTLSDGEKISKKEALALIMWQEALGGDLSFIKAVIAYTDGMPKTFANVNMDNPQMDAILNAVREGVKEDE